MMDFNNEHMSLIEQYEASALDIERILFTGRYRLSRKHSSLLSVQSISILDLCKILSDSILSI